MKLSFDLQAEMAKCRNMEDMLGKNGLFKRMLKEMTEQMLEDELTGHLGYEKHAAKGRKSGNSRNGRTGKKVRTGLGDISLETPRDRAGSFEPRLVKKGQTDITEFDEKIISMYARGMTTRDIQEHVKDFYGVDISAVFISHVTEKVMDLAGQWQARPLESVYPIVFFDAIHYKVRQDGRVVNKAAYTCLGIDEKGHKDVLGIWIGEREGAHYWLGVLNELKNRGVEDILIACVDGLKGFPEAIAQVYPKAETQLCVIHLIRNSVKYVGSKYQKEFMLDLKQVYRAPSLASAETALDTLTAKWGEKYPLAVKPWVTNWANASTYFKYPDYIRKIIYTTNAVESVHRQLRKVTKNRSMFPNDEALAKMLFLAINGVARRWTSPVQNWASIISQLAVFFEGRIKL